MDSMRLSLKNSHCKKLFFSGLCLNGCADTFYLFTLIMFGVNWLSSTGRIGNVLVSLRFD